MSYIGDLFIPLTLGFMACVYLIFLYKKKANIFPLPPGPRGLPLVGIVSPMNHKTLWDHKDRYGDVSGLNVFGTYIVVLNSVESIREAFESPAYRDKFNARPQMFYSQFVMHKDVAFGSPDDPYWTDQRQVLQSFLTAHGKKAAKIERVISEELGVVKTFLLKKSRDGEDFDIDECLAPSLMNIILILLIGERFDYNHDIIRIIRTLIANACYLMEPFTNFFLYKFNFLRHLPFGAGPHYRSTQKQYIQFFQYVFENCKKLPYDEIQKREGLVYDLLRQQEQSAWITDDIIKGSIQDIKGAANSTTKYTLYSFFLILLHYQRVQNRIQQEIDDVIGRGRDPTTADKKQMPYTQAVISELTRYATVAPLSIPHTCTSDTQFSGFTIPRSSMIMANLWRVHFDEANWHNPWVFDPGRFLDADGNLLSSSHPINKNLISFGLGKRKCIGEKFARNRMFLFITHTLQRFSFRPAQELPSCDPRAFICDQNLYPAPYKLRVEPRG